MASKMTPEAKRAAFVRGLRAGVEGRNDASAQGASTGPKRTEAEEARILAAFRRGLKAGGANS